MPQYFELMSQSSDFCKCDKVTVSSMSEFFKTLRFNVVKMFWRACVEAGVHRLGPWDA
jgi:hypothetical protein